VQGITHKLQTVKPLDYYPLSMAYSSNASSKTSYLVRTRLYMFMISRLLIHLHIAGYLWIQQEANSVQ
jgi:hypothetical protein